MAVFVVNVLAMEVIFMTDPNMTPIKGEPPLRLLGVFAARDVLATVFTGILIGLLSDSNDILRGIILQFVLGTLFHIIFGVKTMPFYLLGISDKPDGMGRIAHPII